MILGTAAGLPVIADRWNHMLDCPYCGEVHSHGGWGEKSPAGAANGGRLAHCRIKRRGKQWEGPGTVPPDERFYVLVEVPGTARFGTTPDQERITRHITYDLTRMPDLPELLAKTVSDYEACWRGVDKRGECRPGFNYPPFLRGEVQWRSAYYDRGPAPWGTDPFPAASVEQILYRFYDRFGILLYIGITGDAATRWKNHRKDKNWWPLVARIDIERHASRDDVEAAEKAAIEAEHPIYNVTYNRSRSAHLRRAALALGRGPEPFQLG